MYGTIHRSSSRILSTLEVTTDEYGQFNGSFVVPQGNMLGNYTIQVNGSWANALSISVAEYKLPMFKVEFDPVKRNEFWKTAHDKR